MISKAAAPKLLLIAGWVTWAMMVSGWALSGGLRAKPSSVVVSSAAWLLFIVCFFLVAWPKDRDAPKKALGSLSNRRIQIPILIGFQSLSILGLTLLGHGRTAGVLLAVVAGQVPMVFSGRVSALWICLQTVGFALGLLVDAPIPRAMLTTVGLLGFQLFAATTASLAQREAQARDELSRLYAELLATQSLLADSVRASERIRIGRDLHDTLGHLLTALTLQLEIAKTSAPGHPAIDKAQAIARSMLKEVRGVVQELRSEVSLDLHRALEMLVSGVSGPPIVHLDVSSAVNIDNPSVANVVFRCVQEGVTNALRHAHAENLFVTVKKQDSHLDVVIQDDGLGLLSLREGHGLRGIRERVAAAGGQFEVEAKLRWGVRLHAMLPLVKDNNDSRDSGG